MDEGARLDTQQAAIILAKLGTFDIEVTPASVGSRVASRPESADARLPQRKDAEPDRRSSQKLPMKLCTVVGARPQFVKAATLSRAIARHNAARGGVVIAEQIVHTGQHYDANMSAIFFEELGIPEPAYHLGVGSGLHGWQTGHMLEEIEKILLREKPDLMLVY